MKNISNNSLERVASSAAQLLRNHICPLNMADLGVGHDRIMPFEIECLLVVVVQSLPQRPKGTVHVDTHQILFPNPRLKTPPIQLGTKEERRQSPP